MYFQVPAPEGLYSERRFNGGFFVTSFRGLYLEVLIRGWGLFSEFYGIRGDKRCLTTLSADQGLVPERLINNKTPKVKF